MRRSWHECCVLWAVRMPSRSEVLPVFAIRRYSSGGIAVWGYGRRTAVRFCQRAAKMGPNMVRAPRGREGRTREGTCGPRRGSRRRPQHEASSLVLPRPKRRCGDISQDSLLRPNAHHQRHPCASSCAAHCLLQHRHLLLRTAPHSLPLRAIAPPRRQWPSPTRSRRLSGR